MFTRGRRSSSSSSSGRSSLSQNRPTDDQPVPCEILGFSNSQYSSIDGEFSSENHCNVPEFFLGRLLRHYPGGKIFNFDENGSLNSSGSSDEGDVTRGFTQSTVGKSQQPIGATSARVKIARSKSFSRQDDGANILKLFPTARSVAFFPLWDSHRQRWFAGGFAYSEIPSRFFTVQGELSYLAAFASITMAEVHRLKETLVNKTKTDLLGSLSHELRSPLHGVILGAELLQDTDLNLFQRDVLNSIENCGRTLVDTIDHLLDWTKINKFRPSKAERRTNEISNSRHSRGSRTREGQDKARIPMEGIRSLTSDIDIDVITEQVLESVFAGHCFQNMALMRLADERGTGDADVDARSRMDSMQALESLGSQIDKFGDIQVTLGQVVVSLYINPNCAWAFSTQPGALRRILMNLLGNSLKFTTQGFVKVVLDQEAGSPKHGSDSQTVIITVSDSGCGIGQEFLKHQLFAPFSQENSLSSGPGLGLSLVKKVVTSLHGSINVRSRVNEGTTVTVKLPLKPVHSVTSDDFADSKTLDAFKADVVELQGLRVKITDYPLSHEGSTKDRVKKALIDERDLLSTVCQTWISTLR